MDAAKIEPMVQTMPIIGRLVARQAGVVAARSEAPVAVVKVYVGNHVKKNEVLAVENAIASAAVTAVSLRRSLIMS